MEIEISILFADARGSTALAESTSASRFTSQMNRFSDVAMKVQVHTGMAYVGLVGFEGGSAI